MKDSDERDTLPPTPDPLMGMVEDLHVKLDKLTRVATLCFDKLLDHDLKLKDLDERLAFLEAKAQGNGSVAPDA